MLRIALLMEVLEDVAVVVRSVLSDEVLVHGALGVDVFFAHVSVRRVIGGKMVFGAKFKQQQKSKVSLPPTRAQLAQYRDHLPRPRRLIVVKIVVAVGKHLVLNGAEESLLDGLCVQKGLAPELGRGLLHAHGSNAGLQVGHGLRWSLEEVGRYQLEGTLDGMELRMVWRKHQDGVAMLLGDLVNLVAGLWLVLPHEHDELRLAHVYVKHNVVESHPCCG